MNKSKVIKDIMGDLFIKRGFSYKTETNMWVFEREHQNKAGETINQQVYVQKSTFEKALHFRMYTNAYGRGLVEAHDIAQNNEYIHPYENDQEFIDVINYFAQLMESKGFDFLEQHSEPTVMDRPTESQQEQLYQNHKSLSGDFVNRHQIDLDCDQGQLVETVFSIVDLHKNDPYKNIVDRLIELSAFYGEWLVKHRAARWLCDEKMGGALVESVNEWGCPTYTPPLSRIFLCWERVREFNEREYRELLPSLLALK